jgi:hypothetical protein
MDVGGAEGSRRGGFLDEERGFATFDCGNGRQGAGKRKSLRFGVEGADIAAIVSA